MSYSLKSKHIALVSRSLSHNGGLEKYGGRIGSYLKELGATITIISEKSPKLKQAGTCYQEIPLKGLRHQKIKLFSKKCAQLIKQTPFDVVIGLDRIDSQTHLRAGNGVHAAYLQKKRNLGAKFLPLKTWLNPSHKAILDLEKKAFLSPKLKRIITNSNLVKRELEEYYPKVSVPITTIHNGVEWLELKKPFESWQEDKEHFCKKHGLSPNTFFFLFVGHGFERKGLSFLLKALSLIKDQEVCLLVVGADKRAGYFKKRAHQLGLASNVHFFGPHQNTTPFFQTADSVVIPSIYDPFANVTVEALAMGLFVVSSPYNGGSEVLDRDSGIVIEKLTDPEAFAHALKQALKHKKTKASSIAIRQSVEHLDFSHQLAKFVAAIVEDL